MSNEIKQGDTVRVSKDAPRVFSGDVGVLLDAPGWKVHQVVDDYAFIINGKLSSAIPTKYLIKVDTEAKEPKFKVNDVVRTVFNETTHITAILGNGNYYLYGMGNEYPEDSLTLVEPYTEPTEQREAGKKPNAGSIKIPVEVDLTDSFWDAYTADLAKEIALKVANKFNDPKEAAYYAVSVAKAVVEGLKRK